MREAKLEVVTFCNQCGAVAHEGLCVWMRKDITGEPIERYSDTYFEAGQHEPKVKNKLCGPTLAEK